MTTNLSGVLKLYIRLGEMSAKLARMHSHGDHGNESCVKTASLSGFPLFRRLLATYLPFRNDDKFVRRFEAVYTFMSNKQSWGKCQPSWHVCIPTGTMGTRVV